MPVRKFRRIEDMERPIWREPGDPEIVAAMARLWEVARRTRRRRYPRGVHKHSSIDEMQRVQAAWPATPDEVNR